MQKERKGSNPTKNIITNRNLYKPFHSLPKVNKRSTLLPLTAEAHIPCFISKIMMDLLQTQSTLMRFQAICLSLNFFKKLEQEISDCKSGKGCEFINRNSTQYFPVSRVLFLKHKPTLSMHHLTPSKARLLKNCHSSPEGILAFKTKLSMSNSSIQMQTSKFLRIQINFSKITLLHFPN